MPTAYPSSADAYVRPGTAEILGLSAPTHSVHHDNAYDAIEAIEAKLGTGGAAPPAAAAVLRRTGTGASGWAQVAAGDYAAGSIVTADLGADAVTVVRGAVGTTGAASMSSGTPADLPDLTLATFTPSGGPVVAHFNGTFINSIVGSVSYFDLVLNGTIIARREVSCLIASSQWTVGLSFYHTPASTPSVYKMQWSVSGGATLAIQSIQRTLVVVEHKK